MNVYRGDMATQGEEPRFIRQEHGCEVLTNDRQVKVVLSRTVSFEGEIEQTFYTTKYYVREGSGWEQVNNGQTYPSEDAFFDAIRGTEEFTDAVREMDDIDDSDV
ncbi:MAG: hypothetical protein IJ640_10180 [Prevotella sp.]|nr:hypothetical protein [Prevotella sp.]